MPPSSSSSPFLPLFIKVAPQANAPTTFKLLVEEDAVQRSQLILELLQSHQILLHFRLKEGGGKKKKKEERNAPVQYICQGCLGDLLLCISICFLQNPVESKVLAMYIRSFVRRRKTSSLKRQKPRCFQVQAQQGFQPAWLSLGKDFSYRSLKGARGKHMICQEVSGLLSECLLHWEISWQGLQIAQG